MRFDGLLRAFNPIGDHLRFNRHAFFHTQSFEQRRNPLLGEDAHQVVFERQIEARLARIALAPCAAAQLVVNAPRLMPLGAQDE